MQICSLRKKHGITQEELGKEIGVTAQAVSNWECGGTPDAELLPKIANYFGVSIDHLFGKNDEPKKNIEQELLWELYHTEKEKRFEKVHTNIVGIFIRYSGSIKDNITMFGTYSDEVLY